MNHAQRVVRSEPRRRSAQPCLSALGGFYIDVGAADPVELSVTKWFYDRGWSGINVEPQAKYYAALVDARPRDININALLSDSQHEVTFYEVVDNPLLSTPDPVTAAQFKAAGKRVATRTTHALTLAEVCKRHVRGPIDFLKIDVEGHELSVLQGADFRRWRPVVLVIEATEAERPTPNHDIWEPLVLDAGYKYATFDGLNRYYVRAEDAHLIAKLEIPVNLFDEYFIPYERVLERAAWEAERAAWEAERVAWDAERAVLAFDRNEQMNRVRWLEGQLQLYRAG